MADIFTIDLPATVSRNEVKSLENEIMGIEGVADAGTDEARGVDMIAIGLWVKLIGSGAGALDAGASAIQKIVETIRGKGIKNATITLANGVVIKVDEISAKDLERIIQAANQRAGSRARKKNK